MIIRVKLTVGEKKLLERVNLYSDDVAEGFASSNDAVCDLMRSLLKRNAIPQIRIDWFEKPEHNIGSMQSRRQSIEADGFIDGEIFRHRDFKPMLGYFLDGPALPRSAILKFELATARFLSGSISFHVIQQTALHGVRRSGKDVHSAAEEYYKLALECDLVDKARDVRSYVIKSLTKPQ